MLIKKFTPTIWLGYIGIFIWTATIVLRERAIGNITINNLLGIAPNFGATLFFVAAIEFLLLFKLNKEFNLNTLLVSCFIIIILAFASEIFHDLVLNSKFDPYDMLATLVASGCIIVTYFFKNFRVKHK